MGLEAATEFIGVKHLSFLGAYSRVFLRIADGLCRLQLDTDLAEIGDPNSGAQTYSKLAGGID